MLTLILRDGTRFRFGADGFLTQIEDRNGNLLQISFTSTNTGGIYSVQDSLNRSEDINFTECLEGGNCANNPDTVDAFQYHGSNGSGREAHVNYALLSNALAPGESIQTYQNLFPELNGSSASSFNPYIISSVIFPDGSGYTMQYNAYGEVARLTLPTGGYYTYRYPEAPANTGSGVIGLSDGSYKILRRVLERDEYSDGATLSAKILYVYSGYPSNLDNSHSSRPGTVTEVSSENSGSQLLKYEQHYFSGDPASSQAAPADQSTYAEWWRGLEFFSYVQDGNQILREKNTVYGQRPCEAGANCWVDPQSDNAPARDPQVCQVNTTESDGSVSSVVMAYDQFNNMTDKYEYDYGAAPGIGSGCPGTPGGWKRHTFTVFRNDSQYLDPNVHIVGLPGDTHVYNQNNQAVAYYHWSYDDYNDRPLQDAPGIVAHDGAYGTGFNARGNNTTLWRAEDGTNVSILVRSTFDIAGNLVQQLDGNNHSTTLEYNTDSSNNYAFPTKVTNALNQPTTAAYDYSTGKAGWTMDFTGTVTYQDYDSNDQLDRLTGVRIVSGGNLLQQTTYSYPDPRTMITRSDLTSPGDSLLEVFHLTDGLGRQYVDRTFENASQNQYIETYTGFDALGRVSATANPTRPGDNLNYLTTYSYDALGRIKSTQKPDGSVATVSYSGNSMTATDEAGKARRSYYDALGRLTTVQEDPNGANQFTNYGYDALDNLTSVNQSGQTRTFSYDGLSRLRSATNPESGTTSYTYDGANNLLTKTDGRNTTVTYGYDVINRMTSKSSSDGTVNSTVSRDDVNRQTTTTSPTSNTFYAFDPLGRTTASTQTIAGNNYNFTYQYNAAGLLTNETYPSGRSVSTGYDFGGRAAWMQGNAGGVTKNYIGQPNDQNTWVHYWPHGAIYYYIRGNNVWHAASYNRSLQPTESYEANNNDAGQIYFVSCPNWGENSNNNVYDICPHSSAGQNNGTLKGYDEWHVGLHFNQSFGYDGLNRLTNVTDTGGYTRNFGYDTFGNMSYTSASGINPSPLTPYSGDGSNPFFGNNQLRSGAYDGAGNQTLLGSLQIAYDAENHQISAQDGSYPAYTYAYDGNGQRVLKTIPSRGRTVYVYDAFGKLAAEYSESNEPSPCTTCYLGVDHLGSTRIVIDQNSQPVARHDYLPFGEEVLANTAGRDGGFSSPDDIDPKFTGQGRDGETQLDYFHARYFGATLGRFTSPDPANAGADLMNPQSWNGYAYALNNSLNATDPTGDDTCEDGTQADACVSGGSPDPIQTVFWPFQFGGGYYGSGGSGMSTSAAPGVGKANVRIVSAPPVKKSCTSQRITLAFKGGLSLGVGAAKIKLASASFLSIPVTGPVGVAGAAYGIIGGVGNAAAGVVQLVGAIFGNTQSASNASNVLTTVTTLGGLTTLVITNGDMKAASTAANFESLGTAGLNGGATGHLVDGAATLGQKLLLGADYAQTAADSVGLTKDSSCNY